MNKTLDSLDRKIINLLGKDGRMTVPKIFETLEITNPTARSRIKNLIQQEVLRIVGLIDSSKVRDFSIIIVGISLTRHNELDKKLDQISKLDNVHWAIAVSWRYDIISEIVSENQMDGLYRFLTFDLQKVDETRSTESFMIMKDRGKWIHLPQGMKKWFVNTV